SALWRIAAQLAGPAGDRPESQDRGGRGDDGGCGVHRPDPGLPDGAGLACAAGDGGAVDLDPVRVGPGRTEFNHRRIVSNFDPPRLRCNPSRPCCGRLIKNYVMSCGMIIPKYLESF